MRTGRKTYTERFDSCGIEESAKKVTTTAGNDVYINIYSMKNSIKVNISVFAKLAELSPAALKILNEICKQLEYNDVNVIIEVSKLAKTLGYNRVTVSDAVKELVNAKFIVRIVDTISNKNKHLFSPKMYALNTSLLYMGSNKVLYDKANHIIQQEQSSEALVFIDN